ncbi:MAG: hypothetical protein KDB80_12815 [Planctomycetes bacterium]|nr:hypothetical protein [Planctomycetota bacterium]
MKHLTFLVLAAALPAQAPSVPFPPGNPFTASKALLGKALFWEEQLSSTNTIACGTCHEPKFGGADGRCTTLGEDARNAGNDGVLGTPDDKIASRGPSTSDANGTLQQHEYFGLAPVVGTRQAPTVINAAFQTVFFADGRVHSGFFRDPITRTPVLTSGAHLENLIVEPPINESEMAHIDRTWVDIENRLVQIVPLELSPQLSSDLQAWIAGRDYPALFQEAFGTPEVTASRAIMAIATYLRTQVSFGSPFDMGTLTPRQLHGQQLFSALLCATCHTPPLFTDGQFHNTGVRPPSEDLGRGEFTGDPFDSGKFRTPTLRNVALRDRFFHNGQFSSLEEVIDFYQRSGDFVPNEIPITFTSGWSTFTENDRADLVSFLEALTDPAVATESHPFDRPELGADRAPERFGERTAGSDGFEPRMIAFEPASTKNASFTIGVDRGIGYHNAFLALSAGAASTPLEILGASIHVALDSRLIALINHGPLDGIGPGAGTKMVTWDLTQAPGLQGLELFGQWLFLDPGSEAGLSATEAIRIRFY